MTSTLTTVVVVILILLVLMLIGGIVWFFIWRKGLRELRSSMEASTESRQHYSQSDFWQKPGEPATDMSAYAPAEPEHVEEPEPVVVEEPAEPEPEFVLDLSELDDLVDVTGEEEEPVAEKDSLQETLARIHEIQQQENTPNMKDTPQAADGEEEEYAIGQSGKKYTVSELESLIRE